MEFSPAGIPVRVVIPGDDGFRIWARLDRALRVLWADEDLVNWPACDIPGEGGFINEPMPCWNVAGFTRPEGHCSHTLTELTAEFHTLACRL